MALTPILASLRARLSARPDTEHQQAILRLLVGVVLFFYLVPLAFGGSEVNLLLVAAMVCYLTLCAAVFALDPTTQRVICDLLGDIQYPHAGPTMLELSMDAKAPEVVREAARRAYRAVGGVQTDLAIEFTNLGRQYFNGAGVLVAYPSEDTNNVWAYDAHVGLIPTPVPTVIYNEVMAMKSASKALAVSSDYRPALALMVASGFAALGYQIVWTQQSALWLGHESAAVLAIVAAFFGGLAVGALVLSPRIDRSLRPVRWYAGCELVIGLWRLAIAFLLAPITSRLLDLIGAQPAPVWLWSVVFCGTFVLLLPATAAMGATLPAMERTLAQMRRQGSPIAVLYAGNTFGAVLGVLAAAFGLVPGFGLMVTAGVCATLNFLCAAAAMKLFAEPAHRSQDMARSHGRGVLVMLAATGLLGIGYEVLVVRVLSQVAENTVYTFAILLAVYLVGTALGAAAYDRWLSGTNDSERLCDRLLRTLAATCLLGTLNLAGAETLEVWVLHALGTGMAAALTAEAALASAAFLLPTVVMGALFSHLATNARAAGISFGRALGVNTLGAAVAPLLFGVMLMAGLGQKFALLLVAAGYLALSSRRAWSAAGTRTGRPPASPPAGS